MYIFMILYDTDKFYSVCKVSGLMDYTNKVWREFYRHILPDTIFKCLFFFIHEQAWFVLVYSCACVFDTFMSACVLCFEYYFACQTTVIVDLFFQLVSYAAKCRVKYCIIIIVVYISTYSFK